MAGAAARPGRADGDRLRGSLSGLGAPQAGDADARRRPSGARVDGASGASTLRSGAPIDCQAERRQLAHARRAALVVRRSGPNQVWQLDFSEFETTRGGIWRIGGVADS
ncbi:MAG: hypothetical protein H0X39_20245 [Actinobacteria bacterium]|nr:hypothetical protein [Actinomycetota bacterium]